MKPLVVYHGNCADGFTAAWLANLYFSQAAGNTTKPSEWFCDPHPGVYGEAPPDVTGREVYILDFSYGRAQMLALGAAAKNITIIDHHQTSIEALDGIVEEFREKGLCPLVAYLSAKRSGAYLASKFFWPGVPPMQMVELVDDRDRWQFQYPLTKPFHASLFSRFYTLDAWNELSASVSHAADEGRAIERKMSKDVQELLDVCVEFTDIGGHRVPTANLPYVYASEAGHEMLKRHLDAPFAATWYTDKKGQRVFSLRSRQNEDVDVAKIAQKFGGGGHKHASAFRVPAVRSPA